MKATKQQLQEQAAQSSRDAGILHMALNDALNGKMAWFRKGQHKLGISRECSASGGIVIHTYKTKGSADYSCAYYWEDWVRGVMAGEITDLRDCASQALAFVIREQNKVTKSSATESWSV